MKHRNHIAEIRKRLKLRQPGLAKLLKLNQTTLSTYETGKVQMPVDTALALIRLCRGHKLLIDLNHVFAEADLPPDEAPAARKSTAPAQAAQGGG